MIPKHLVAQFRPSSDNVSDTYRCNQLWKKYHDYAFLIECKPDFNVVYENFQQHRFLIDTLEPATTRMLNEVFDKAQFKPVSLDVVHPQYLRNGQTDEQTARVNREHVFFDIRARELWAVWDALEEISPLLTAAFGAPWRFMGIKAWLTAEDTEYGMTSWHYDGCPEGAIKLMMYLSETAPGKGGIEIELSKEQAIHLNGPAGTWILFDNSRLYHRGRGPEPGNPPRRVVEITLGPSYTQRTRPFYAGNGSRHPREPWVILESHLFC